jgi:hypothetical protein
MLKPSSGLAALVLILALSLFVIGCGGGDDQSSDTTVTTAAQAAIVQPVANTVPARHSYEGLVGTQLEPTEETPAAVKDALTEGRPVLVFFYVAGSYDDGLVRETIDKLLPKYEDITLAAFDFKAPDAFGDLARLLQIDYPPQLVFIDTAGVVRSVLSGYADEGTLNQHLVNIRQG